MVDGYWQIPEGPGLGIEVDEVASRFIPLRPKYCTLPMRRLQTARLWIGDHPLVRKRSVSPGAAKADALRSPAE